MRDGAGRVLRWLPPLALAVWAAFGARDFLADGLPVFFDAHSHLARSWMSERALAAGHYPSWSNAWYTGFRPFEFYSPGYHLVTGALSLLIGDVVAATRWVLFLGQIASALAFHAFVRCAVGSRWLAVFAAVLFVASPERTTVIGLVGNYPTLFVYLFAPLLLACVCHLGRRGELGRLAAAQALLLGACLVCHLTNTLALLPALLAFEIAWLCSAGCGGRSLGAGLGAIGAGLAGALLIAGFVLEPYLFDLHRVSLSLDEPGLAVDASALLRALGWLPYDPTHAFAQALPAWCWGLGAAAALASLHPAAGAARPLAVGLLAGVLSLVVVGERSAVALDLFLLPLCAAGLGLVGRFGSARGWPALRRAIPAVALASALVWAGWLPGGRAHYQPGDALEIYTELPPTRLPSRTFDVTATTISLDGFYGWSSFSPFYSGRSIPFGAFPQGTPLSSNLTAALVGVAAAELLGDPPVLSEDAADLFSLLNVEFLVDRGTPGLRRRLSLGAELRPVLPSLRYDRSLGTRTSERLFRLRHASPALFAPRIEAPPAEFLVARPRRDAPSLLPLLERRWREEPPNRPPSRSLNALFRAGEGRDGLALLPLLRRLELDRAGARAARFWVEPDGLASLAPQPDPAAAASDSRFEVLAHREELASAVIEARSQQPGWVRVSYAYDPALEFRLDGEPVPALADALGSGSIVRFPAGTHTISLGRRPDAARMLLRVLSLALGSGLLVYLVRGSRLAVSGD